MKFIRSNWHTPFLIGLLLISLKCGSHNVRNIFGTWILDSVSIDDKVNGLYPSGFLPAGTKSKMKQNQGQIWTFNPDSTVTMRKSLQDSLSGKMPFVLSEINGSTVLKIGHQVPAKIIFITDTKMDLVANTGIVFTMHFTR